MAEFVVPEAELRLLAKVTLLRHEVHGEVISPYLSTTRPCQ